MKRAAVLLALVSVLFSCASMHRTSSRGTDGYDVYLLIGQSNMAGRGYMAAADTLKPLDGVWLLGPEDKPVPARNPLNQYSTIRKGIEMQQIGPGLGFSQALLEHDGRKILLVVNARGGSKLDEWVEGTRFYAEAVRRCREAMKYGTLKGIIWHQGCSDSSDELRETYLDRLAPMVKALRRDIGVGDAVPFIAGELPYWRPSSAAFNRMLKSLPEVIPNSGLVSAGGCGMRGEPSDPHFDRDGQLVLGRRYAEKLLEMSSPSAH